MSIRTCHKCGQQFIGGHRCLIDQPKWEARRWCKGDDAWTNWQPCTPEQKASWELTGDFQFRATSGGQIMADKIEAHLALVKAYAKARRAGPIWFNELAAVEASARALAQGEPGEARCANCGAAGASVDDGDSDGELYCSQECQDQHDALGCPHGTHNGFRHPIEARRLIECEDVLRSLASWLGAGGYNAPTVDPKVFEEKIRWGVDEAIKDAVRLSPTASAPAAGREPTQAEIVGAVARGWCHPMNSKKEMDAELALAISDEVCRLLGIGTKEPAP